MNAAEKRAARWRQCIRKKRYRSESEAAGRAHLLRDRQRAGMDNRAPIAYYKCKFCDMFHVGHIPRKALGNSKLRVAKKWLIMEMHGR